MGKKKKLWYTKWWVILLIIFSITIFLFGSTIYKIIYENMFEKQYTRDNFEQIVTDRLEEKGYEVIWILSSEFSGGASVNMKSLGDRQSQVEDAIFELSYYSTVAELKPHSYSVTILEPTQTCFYTTLFSGEVDGINMYMDTAVNHFDSYNNTRQDQYVAYRTAINNIIKHGNCN